MENINHAVQYDHFGSVDVLYITVLSMPEPKAGEVLVKIKAAGINPGEASIREGRLAKQFPSTFPSGQGSDLAGVIEKVGPGVKNFKPGDEVIGFSHTRSSHAEFAVIPLEQLVFRPENVSWEQGGGLFVAGTTAYSAVNAVSLKEGETLIVSAAAGGVGSVAVQLAKNKGVTVLGIASEPNHSWLKKHGIIPVAYTGNVAENIKSALDGKKADAFIDASGKGYVELAINMGIPADRIDTVIDFEAAAKYKVKTDGSAASANAQVLKELVQMISGGELEVPIAKTYPLTKVKEAYQQLEQKHTHGKIVLIASAN